MADYRRRCKKCNAPITLIVKWDTKPCDCTWEEADGEQSPDESK